MKNITFLTGYYGSGKTEVTINLAIQKQLHTVVDLDIINPYFRSREMGKVLETFGIESISSDLSEKVHLDMPYVSSKIFRPFHHPNEKAIYDLGGNDQGAKLLRQFDNYHKTPVDLYIVCNIYRYETSDASKILRLINKIEGMGGFKVTGLINNSNLLRETTTSDILAGQAVLREVSQQSNLPIVFTTVWEKVGMDQDEVDGELIRLKLYFRKDWL